MCVIYVEKISDMILDAIYVLIVRKKIFLVTSAEKALQLNVIYCNTLNMLIVKKPEQEGCVLCVTKRLQKLVRYIYMSAFMQDCDHSRVTYVVQALENSAELFDIW